MLRLVFNPFVLTAIACVVLVIGAVLLAYLLVV